VIKRYKLTLNKKLYSLYAQTHASISKVADKYNRKSCIKEERTAYPLFIKSNSGYENADIKLLIFGKETNGWSNEKNKVYGSDVTLIEILNAYDNFFNKKECYKRKSNFWPRIREFINILQEKNENEKIDYLWNNIVKMAYYWKVGFPDFYEDIVKKYLNKIIIKEIEILKPDYLLFFTGPTYDFVLDDIFENPTKEKIGKFSEREICRVKIKNVKGSFRTYHPNYLIRSGLFYKITKEIINNIK
jgi:hypothetical protein